MRSARQETSRFALWRSAGIWVGALALGLVGVGLILSFEQSQKIAVDRIEAEQRYAQYLVLRTQVEFELEVRKVLSRFAERLWNPSDGGQQGSSLLSPLADASASTWVKAIVSVVSWDGRRLAELGRPSQHNLATDARISSALEARRLTRLRRDLRPPPAFPANTYSAAADYPPLSYDDLGEAGVLLVSVPTRNVTRRSSSATGGGRTSDTGVGGYLVMVAAVVDKKRLRSGLIEPLVGVGSRLELATEYNDEALWYEPIGLGLRYWAIQPSAAFVRAQRAAGARPTLVYGFVTVPSLAAVLLMLWLMFRLARRERALSQMKSNFVADVSHELKTPLALIRLFGETLLEGRVSSDDKRQEYYDVILRESTRLTHLIDNLLDFSRVEAGGKEYQLSPHDIGDVIRETYEDYRHELEHHGFEHRITVAQDLPHVRMDRDAIAQSMINLMGNAIKYSDDDRFLAIDVERDTRRGNRGVLISVHDRGIGITPEDRSHIFEGFFRASDRRVRDRRGAGLGLALVKHIVTEHGGTIWVESRLVKGSTFRVFLPATDDTPKSR